MNDIISSTYMRFVYWCDYMRPETFSYIVKAALLLLAPLAFVKAAIAQGAKSKGQLGLCVLLGVLLAAAWPVPEINHPQIKAWIVALSLFAMVSLPIALPKEIIDTFGAQKKAIWILYGLFLLLTLAQISGG